MRYNIINFFVYTLPGHKGIPWRTEIVFSIENNYPVPIFVCENLHTVRSAYSEPSGDHAIMFILQGLHIKQTCFSSLIMSSNL